MSDASIRWIRRGLWTVVGLFFLLSGAAAYGIHRELGPTGMHCANCVTSMLSIMLNYLAPIALASTAGLAWLRASGARLWAVAIAGLLSIASIAGFVAFGTSFFQNTSGGHQLSSVVWWMF